MTVGYLDCLRAIEPEGCRDINDKVLENDTSVVGRVELIEASVKAACFGRARGVKIGLCYSMVSAVEIEARVPSTPTITVWIVGAEEVVDVVGGGVEVLCAESVLVE